ncbi:MAG: histidine--tRNA ligase [Hydrogenophilus sp.]|nr:histidine--tRNA ligase [Hydrogenophilus sp.]
MEQGAIRGVRGMNDVLPPESLAWVAFEELVHHWASRYGYLPVRTPVVEPTALFVRAIGTATDVVEKEMYAFKDALNGEELTLRPEGTAGVVRAAIEHHLVQGGVQRFYYWGPMFRHERPQKGRFRQFHQVGVEALGTEDPALDAELMVMGARLWEDLGLQEVQLEINSLGDLPERAAYREALVNYFERYYEALDEESRRRLRRNPLRILDSKNPAMRELIEGAPRLLDFLGPASRAHFEAVRQFLEDAGVPYRINPYLVRGLDYYNRTVFEWITPMLGSQGTICAGGRYDGLFAQLGGRPTPAAGFALGVERVLTLWEVSGGSAPEVSVDTYVVHWGEESARTALQVGERLRAAGMSTVVHFGGGSLKSQLRRANSCGAKVAVIIGEEELRAQEATIKPLRGQGTQERVGWEQLEERVWEVLLGKKEQQEREESREREERGAAE